MATGWLSGHAVKLLLAGCVGLPTVAAEAARPVGQAAASLTDIQDEAARLAAERVAAAATLRASEAATAAAVARLDLLTAGRRLTEQRLAARAGDLTPLLPLIERLSLFPAETLLAIPGNPTDAVRGVLVLKGLTRQIEQDAEAVQRDHAQLEDLAREQLSATQHLAALQAAQAAQAASLDKQIADAQRVIAAAQDAGAATIRREADQAARATSLRNAIVTMQGEREADSARAREEAARAQRQRRDSDAAEAARREAALVEPAGADLAAPRARLVLPVAGSVVRNFGDMTQAGSASGISYRAPPQARVVSPCSGRMVFAGPFRSFGLLLIVDCGGGYHFVLAGLQRLDVQVGQKVQAGEPVGVMPDWNPGANPGANSGANALGGGERPALYIELRHDGVPVNPNPWLNAGS